MSTRGIIQYGLLGMLAGWILTACHSSEEMAYSTDPVENVEALWQIIDTR